MGVIGTAINQLETKVSQLGSSSSLELQDNSWTALCVSQTLSLWSTVRNDGKLSTV